MNSQHSQDQGLNLFEQEHRRDIKAAVAITGLVALGVAAALGAGFVLGGRGSSRESAVAGAASTATRTVPASPAARAATPPAAAANNTGNTGTTAPGAPASTGNGAGQAPASGDAPSGDPPAADPPAPTNTPVPPAPTNPSVPPTATSTPVPPTNTPTATATATATATPPFEICIPCIDPGVIIHLDFTPPVFSNTQRMDCPSGTWLSFDTDEDAELWVTYTVIGLPMESPHINGTHFGDTVASAFFHAQDVVFHATDGWGNTSTFNPALLPCV